MAPNRDCFAFRRVWNGSDAAVVTHQYFSRTNNVLSEEVEYREGRQVRRGSRLEAIIRKPFSEAMRGEVSSADKLLKMREHAETHGDVGPTVIKIDIPWSTVKNL